MPAGQRRVLGVALVVVALDPARGLAVGADPLVAHRVEGVEEREATAHHETAPEQDADARSAPPGWRSCDGSARAGPRGTGAGRPRRRWCTGAGCSCGHCCPAGRPAHEAGYSGHQGRQPAGGSSPTSPSTASRSRSAWPVCRPYSSIRSQTSRRRLACSPVGRRGVDELVEPAVGQGRVEPGAGPLDGAVPERVELLGGVVGGGGELPVVAAVPAGGVPRRADRLAAQLGGEVVVLARPRGA